MLQHKVEVEECAALHVISALSGATNLNGISVYFVSILWAHACSGWRTPCLSEAVATLSRPALDQDQWGNSLVCLAAAFYVCILRWDQVWHGVVSDVMPLSR